MAVTLDLQPKPQWETIEAGDKSLRLLVRRAPRTVRIRAATNAEKDLSGAIQMLLDESVLDWDQVKAPDGTPIPFSKAGLDVLMNTEDWLADEIQGKLLDVNSMGKSGSDPTSTPQPTPTGT